MSQQSQYPLGGGNLAGCRLDLQHTHTRDIFDGHLLSPAIQLPETVESLCVADVCTGTGIWLLQLARQYQKSKFEGLDINLTQTLHASLYPPNIHFSEFDIFAAVPENLLEKYDVINIQYTYLLFSNAKILEVLKKLTSMLKSRGWLQFTDMDATNHRVLTPDKTPASGEEAISTIVQSTYALVGFKPETWTSQPNLTALFAEAGLTDIEYHRPELSLSALGLSTQDVLWGIEEVYVTGIESGRFNPEGPGGAASLLQKLKLAWQEHKEKGLLIDMRTFRCVGRKR